MSQDATALTDLSFRSILIGDDDRLMRKYLENQLAPLGCRLLEATNGEEVLEQARRLHPDIILLDVVMPGLDGFEVCQRIKTDPATQDITVIHLTGLGRDAKDRSFKSGADDFLNKPPHFVELRSRLRSHLLIKSLQGGLYRAAEPRSAPQWEPRRSARILALFTHPNLRSHVMEELERAGHEVFGASAIAEALPLLGRSLPDLLVMDQYLQDGNGVALAANLRTFQRTLDLPILLVCARKNLEEDVQTPDPGPTDYLTKPFLPAELLLRVGVLLRQGGLFQGRDAVRSPLGRHLLKDPATDLFTGGFLEAHLDYQWPLLRRLRQPLALLALRVPTCPGSDGLDACLARLQGVFGPGEALCRVADRTLVAVLPGVDEAAARQRLATLRDAGITGPAVALQATDREATPGALLARLAGALAAAARP